MMPSNTERAVERVIGLRVRMLRNEVEALLEADDPIAKRVAELARFVEAELRERARQRPKDRPVPLVNGHAHIEEVV